MGKIECFTSRYDVVLKLEKNIFSLCLSLSKKKEQKTSNKEQRAINK
jgi:hypothetical protein